MLALIMSAMIISTQSPSVTGIVNPPNRNRRMQYGKSRAAAQPFMCKPKSLEATDVGPVPAFKSMTENVGDGIKRVKVFESASDIEKNPIEILAEMNRLRVESGKVQDPLVKSSTKIADSSNIKTQNSLPQQKEQQQVQEPAKKSWQKPAAKSSSGLANIYWRAVDVEDLRAHPYFDRWERREKLLRLRIHIGYELKLLLNLFLSFFLPSKLLRHTSWLCFLSHTLCTSLPLPDDVCALNAAEYSLFRQDSWQWGALHAGRLTTARAAACLGFYEKESANVLKVPRSLSGHSKVNSILLCITLNWQWRVHKCAIISHIHANNSPHNKIETFPIMNRLYMRTSIFKNSLLTVGTFLIKILQ